VGGHDPATSGTTQQTTLIIVGCMGSQPRRHSTSPKHNNTNRVGGSGPLGPADPPPKNIVMAITICKMGRVGI